MEQPPTITETEAEAVPAETEGLARGVSLGRYLVLEVLGSGGMGLVVNAYDPELDRRLAIKLLRTRQTGEEAAEGQARLLREAQAMARLSHPNVIAVHDVGTWRDRVFVAMELVEGGTLRQWLQERPRPWRKVVELFVAAGHGLAAAHAAGIIHRDFKPSNVLVGTDGRVRVTDFGLARSLAGPEETPTVVGLPAVVDGQSTPSAVSALSSPLTILGTVLGTPGYMAPEQIRGAPADARSDQFAFCIALWEGLYRARPFDGRNAAEIADRVLTGRLSDPPAGGKVPARLRRLLTRGLAVAPESRFPSMDALLAELARDPALDRRKWVVSGLAVLALFCAAVGLYQVSQRQGRLCGGAEQRLGGVWDGARKSAARKAFLATGRFLAEDTLERAAGILDSRARAWAAMRTEATRVRGDQSAEIMDLRMACLESHLEELRGVADVLATADASVVDHAVKYAEAVSPLQECAELKSLTAPVRLPASEGVRAKVAAIRADLSRGKGLLDAARFKEAVALSRPAVQAARALGWRPLEAEASSALGDALFENGQTADAEVAIAEALWAALASGHARIAAETATHLVFLLQAQAKLAEADRYLPLARALVERLGDDPGHQAGLADVTAILSSRHGRFEEALRETERSLPLAIQAFGPESLAVGQHHSDLGQSLVSVGRLEEGIAQYRLALAITEKRNGPEHPEVGYVLNGLASAVANAGHVEESSALAARALALFEKSLGPDHPETAFARIGVASGLGATGHCDRAVPMLERARRDLEAARGADHPSVAEAHQALGECARSLGRLDEALAHYRRVREIYEKKLGPDHPWLESPLGAIGSIELERGRLNEALPLLERSVKLGQGSPENPFELHDFELQLARALWAKGDRKRARSMAEKSRDGWAKVGPSGVSQRKEADQWLRTHRP
jgi:tetratricopeptide (TPR) repeat protein